MTTETLTPPASRTARGKRATSCSSEPAPSTCRPASPRRARQRGVVEHAAQRRRRAASASSGTSSAFSPVDDELAEAAHVGRHERRARRRAPPARTSGRPFRVATASRRRRPRPSARARRAARRGSGRARRRRSRRPAARGPGAAARRRRSRASRPAPAAARGSRARGSSAPRAGRPRARARVPGSRPSSERSAGGGRGRDGVRDRRERREARAARARPSTPGPHATGGEAGQAQQPGRPRASPPPGTPWTLTRPGGRRPRSVARPVASAIVGLCACTTSGRVSRDGPANGARGGRNSPRPALDERHRERLGCPARRPAVPAPRRRRPRGPPRAAPRYVETQDPLGARRCRAPGSRGGCAQFLVERDGPPASVRSGENSLGGALRARLRPSSRAPVGVAGELRRARRPARVGLSGSTTQAGLAVDDQLRDPADARADDRQAGGHRLEDRRAAGCRRATAARARRAPASRSRTSATKPWKRASTPAVPRLPLELGRGASRRRRSRAAAAPRTSRAASSSTSIPFQYSRFAATPATSTSCPSPARTAPVSIAERNHVDAAGA